MGVERLYIASRYDKCIFAEPLGSTYGLDDERIGGWGRTLDELRSTVRSACREQLSRRAT